LECVKFSFNIDSKNGIGGPLLMLILNYFCLLIEFKIKTICLIGQEVSTEKMIIEMRIMSHNSIKGGSNNNSKGIMPLIEGQDLKDVILHIENLDMSKGDNLIIVTTIIEVTALPATDHTNNQIGIIMKPKIIPRK
jgi:hypothetical protein